MKILKSYTLYFIYVQASNRQKSELKDDDETQTQISAILEPNAIFYLGIQQLPDRPNHVIDRRQSVNEIQELLVKNAFNSVLQVYGVAASGKSLLVNQVARNLYQKGFWRGVVYVNLQGIQNQQDVAIEICKSLEVLNYQSQIPPSQVLTQWLQRKANGYPKVGIILDNVDSFAQWTETWTNFVVSLLRLLHNGGSEFQLVTTSRFKDVSLMQALEDAELPAKSIQHQVGVLSQEQAISFLKAVIQPSLPKALNQQVALSCIYNPFVTYFAAVNILYGVISPLEIAQLNNKDQTKPNDDRQSTHSQEDKKSDISQGQSPGREREVVNSLANILRICLRGWSERDKLAIFSLTTIPLVTSQDLGQRALQCGTSVTRANATFRRLQARGILTSRRSFGEYRMEGILRQALLQPEILQGQMVLLQGGAMVSSLICVQSTQQVLLQFFADRLRMVCMQLFGGLGLSAYHLIAREIQIINWAIQIASQGHPAAAEALKSIQQSILWGGASVLPLHLQNLLLQALVDQPMWQGSEATRKNAEVMKKLVAYKILSDQGKPNVAQGYLASLEELIQNEEQLDVILLGRALLLLGHMWTYMRKPIYSIQKLQKALDAVHKPLQKLSKVPNPDWQVQDTNLSQVTPLSAPYSHNNTVQSEDTYDDLESLNKSIISQAHSPDHSTTNYSQATTKGGKKGSARSFTNFNLRQSLKGLRGTGDGGSTVGGDTDRTWRRKRQKKTQAPDEKKDKQVSTYFKAYFNKQIQPTERQVRKEERKKAAKEEGYETMSDVESIKSLQNPTKRLFRAFSKQQKQQYQGQGILFQNDKTGNLEDDKGKPKTLHPLDGSNTPKSSQIGASTNLINDVNLHLGLNNTNRYSNNSVSINTGSSGHDPFSMLKSRRANADRLNQQIYLVDAWDTEEFQLEILRLDLLVEYAEALRTLRQYDEAERQLKLAHYYASNYLGHKHPRNVLILLRLGQLDLLRGAPHEAQKHLSQALLLHRHHEGLYGKHVFTILKLLVQACRQQNQYQQALDLAEECLMVVRLMLGPDTPNEAEVSYQVAQIQEDQGNFAGALVNFCASLRIKEMVLGSYDRSVLKTVLHIIKVKKALTQMSGIEDPSLTKLRRKTKAIIKQQKFGKGQNGENIDFTTWIEMLRQYSPELFDVSKVTENLTHFNMESIYNSSRIQNILDPKADSNSVNLATQKNIPKSPQMSKANNSQARQQANKIPNNTSNGQTSRLGNEQQANSHTSAQVQQTQLAQKGQQGSPVKEQKQISRGGIKQNEEQDGDLRPIQITRKYSRDQSATPARSEQEVYGSPYGSDAMDIFVSGSYKLQQREQNAIPRGRRSQQTRAQETDNRRTPSPYQDQDTQYLSKISNQKSGAQQSEYFSEEEVADLSHRSKEQIMQQKANSRYGSPMRMREDGQIEDRNNSQASKRGGKNLSLPQPQNNKQINVYNDRSLAGLSPVKKQKGASPVNREIEQQLSQKIDNNWQYLKELMLEAKNKTQKDNYIQDFGSDLSGDNDSRALSNYLFASKMTLHKNSGGDHEISELFKGIKDQDKESEHAKKTQQRYDRNSSLLDTDTTSQNSFQQQRTNRTNGGKQKQQLQQVQEGSRDSSQVQNSSQIQNGYKPKFKGHSQENQSSSANNQPSSQKEHQLAHLVGMLPTPGERFFKVEDSVGRTASLGSKKRSANKGKQFKDFMDDLDNIITKSDEEMEEAINNDNQAAGYDHEYNEGPTNQHTNTALKQIIETSESSEQFTKGKSSALTGLVEEIEKPGRKSSKVTAPQRKSHLNTQQSSQYSAQSELSISPRESPVKPVIQQDLRHNQNSKILPFNSPRDHGAGDTGAKKIWSHSSSTNLKSALLGNKNSTNSIQHDSQSNIHSQSTRKSNSTTLQGPLRHKEQAKQVKLHSKYND